MIGEVEKISIAAYVFSIIADSFNNESCKVIKIIFDLTSKKKGEKAVLLNSTPPYR